MKVLVRFILFLTFLVCSGISYGQQILFRSYSVNDGLCSNTVWTVTQDAQGFMWFGTKDGLNRFDGYSYRSYRYNPKNQKSLGNNFIHRIVNADDTHLWIATDEGVYILDLKTEVFSKFDPVGTDVVYDVFKGSNGLMWISTRGHGLYSYDPKSQKTKHYTSTTGTLRLSSNQIRKVTEDNDGNIWIAAFGGGVDVLNYKSGKIKYHKANVGPGSITTNLVLELYKDKSGNIWIGTLAGGLTVWNRESNSFRTYTKGAGNSINDNTIRAIYQPSPDKIYLGTEKGLNILNLATGLFTSHTVKNNDPRSISDNAIYSIFQDREGGTWVGTYFGGVSYFREKGYDFELFYPNGDDRSLTGNAVSAFLEDKPGYFWIATEDGGLDYFNSYNKTFRHYPFESKQQSLSYHNIHALHKDQTGNIWIGTFISGLNVYNPNTGKVIVHKHSPTNPKTISNNTVYSIYQASDGRIWIGTVFGLNVFNPVDNTFTRITEHGLEDEIIYAITEDANGNMWFATYDNGLIGKEKASGKWITYSEKVKGNSISSNKVISMLDDHSGNLWLGTDGGGLNVFNIDTRTFKTIDLQTGEVGSVIYGILKDNKGNMWMSSNNGLYKYNPLSGKTYHYTQWDNLQSKQFNYNAAYKASDGKFFFGGVKGFNTFYPDSIKSVDYPQHVSITNFQLFNKDVGISDEDSPIDKIINYADQIVLNHGQSVISFDFAALSYISPQKTQYAYKMVGFDKGWNYVGEQRKATYTNLPAGTYELQIKSTDHNGNWSEDITHLKIKVLPPFYKTTLAYFLYFILAILAFIFGQRYVLREARRRNQINLERLKNREEQEFYKQKIDFFTTMAHEIRTPLSLIVAPLERLMNAENLKPEINEQLQVMGENSERLQTLVTQLLDFRRIESDIYEIHKEKVEIVALVQSLYTRFYPVAYQKGIKFSVETKISHLNVDADPEALTKILSNLLINAFKFTRTKVKIKILEPHIIEPGQTVFSVSIEDDGIGIPEEQVNNIFKKFFKVSAGQYDYSNLGGTGIGLALAKSLSEKHDGSLLVESKEGVKTVFTVQIPVNEEFVEMSQDIPVDANTDSGEERPLILIAEDDKSMHSFILKSLQTDGYKVIGAYDGAQAISMLENHPVDLIISDVMMPETDGLELCKKVKSNISYSHIPFILLTAKANSEAEIQGFENGADAYITKPFKWKHVSVIIRNLLGTRIALKQKFTQQPFIEPETLTTNTRDSKFIQKIIQTIEERITDPQLSVEELSREMAMSRSSLHKKLKSMTGNVPNEFIRLVRLKHAAKLLSLHEYNVSEVGYMVGFNSHSYFSKCFYQQFNQTPTEFAENKGQNVQVEIADEIK